MHALGARSPDSYHYGFAKKDSYWLQQVPTLATGVLVGQVESRKRVTHKDFGCHVEASAEKVSTRVQQGPVGNQYDPPPVGISIG